MGRKERCKWCETVGVRGVGGAGDGDGTREWKRAGVCISAGG